jgi:hypothetical protein
MRAILICPLNTPEQTLYEVVYSGLWLVFGLNSFCYERVHPLVFAVLHSGCFPQPNCWEFEEAVDFAARVIVGFPNS